MGGRGGGGPSWQKTAAMASAAPLADLQPYSLLLLLLELYVRTTSTECSSQRFAKKGKKLAFFAGTLSKIIESPKKPVDVYITLSKSRLWGGGGGAMAFPILLPRVAWRRERMGIGFEGPHPLFFYSSEEVDFSPPPPPLFVET